MTTRQPPLNVELPTLRDVVRPIFRYRHVVVFTFILGLTLTAIAVAFAPRVYSAEMKILIKRERLDQIMTSDAQTPSSSAPHEVSESELYSEVELIQSRDLLEGVVRAVGLSPNGERARHGDASAVSSPRALARAVGSLRARLNVQPLRKTTLIRVTYQSRDPRLAAETLEQLAALYLEKHLAVHRPEGAHQFFTDQAERLREELRAAEARLREFTAREQVVSARAEKDTTLQTLSQFEAQLAQTEAAIREATRRLGSVQTALTTTPDRHVTQIRDAGNIEFVRGLKSQILQLEVKRNEMLQKFAPQYPPVMRLEEELGQLRDALASAERTPLRDETTDENPTYQWLLNEAARVRTEHDALIARAAAMRRMVSDYRERAHRLDGQSIEQQNLLRAVKSAEENLLLYRRKQEETRISDALDRTRIANVAVAEAPTVPQSPLPRHRRLIVLGGGLLALVSSLGVAFLLHALNPYFRTSDEVSRALDVPVLASLPATAR